MLTVRVGLCNVPAQPSNPDPLLSAREEAALAGVHESTIARCCRRKPDHPVNGPDGTGFGSHKGAPRSLIVTFHAQHPHPRRSGPRATAQALPGGLTPARWRALQQLAADPGARIEPSVRNRLTEAGLITPDGKLTDAALTLVAPTPQEQP